MSPDRRKFLLGAIAAVGGSAMLDACKGKAEIEPTNLEKFEPKFYTLAELALIARISDLVLPRTETPGALDVGVPAMMDGLMAGWASEERKLKQRDTLAKIKVGLDEIQGSDFIDLQIEKATESLRVFDLKAFDEASGFPEYRTFKRLLETVYAASEGGATEEYRNDPVPGRWDPRVPLNTFAKAQ